MVSVLVVMFLSKDIFGISYIYTNTKKDQSSISSVKTVANPPTFSFQSEAQYLIEPTTNTVLYANNENEKLLPASVTKVMTLLLIMEQIDSGKLKYDDKITCSENASKMGGSQIWFKQGEELTVEECLKAICVVSANDVTVAMAEHIAGNEENFVNMMNEKAKTLGMENTHFMNAHGIDEDGHYTTAKDIAIMSRELIINHPDILKYTSIWMDTLRNGEFTLSNTNKLIKTYEGATGLKTGSTSQALFNLVSTATRNGTTYLAVVMRAPTSAIRAEESTQLLNYGFSNYEVEKIFEKGSLIDEIKIEKSINNMADIVIKDECTILKNKGEKIEVDKKIEYNENLVAPLEENEVVGKVQIINKATNEVIDEKELIVKNKVDKSTFKDFFIKFGKSYLLHN